MENLPTNSQLAIDDDDDDDDAPISIGAVSADDGELSQE